MTGMMDPSTFSTLLPSVHPFGSQGMKVQFLFSLFFFSYFFFHRELIFLKIVNKSKRMFILKSFLLSNANEIQYLISSLKSLKYYKYKEKPSMLKALVESLSSTNDQVDFTLILRLHRVSRRSKRINKDPHLEISLFKYFNNLSNLPILFERAVTKYFYFYSLHKKFLLLFSSES